MESRKNESSQKNKSTVSHKILTAIGIVLCVILIPILVINCTLIIKSWTNSDDVPSIGGVFPMIVMTDSMADEIVSGDLIICHTEDSENIKVGDIITFWDPAGNGSSIVTHRVAEITTDENGNLEWITKGDANNTEDQTPVPASDLIGIYKFRIAGLGNVAMFMQTVPGLLLCVVLPIIILIVYDIIRRRIYEKQNKVNTDELLAELEELKKEKAKENTNTEETSSSDKN